jgi:hypothetical protein
MLIANHRLKDREQTHDAFEKGVVLGNNEVCLNRQGIIRYEQY